MENFFKLADEKKLKNPFKEDENFRIESTEVMEQVDFIRKIDDIEIAFNQDDNLIEIKFKKEDLILALEITYVYTRGEDSTLWINEIETKIENSYEDLEKIFPFVKEENKFKIKIKEDERFNMEYQTIAYKITSFDDDEFYLREQLDSFNKK